MQSYGQRAYIQTAKRHLGILLAVLHKEVVSGIWLVGVHFPLIGKPWTEGGAKGSL